MPNSATLVQALGAAFCAILCALSGMGGVGMMIGARTAAWAKSGGVVPYDEELVYLESNANHYIDTGIRLSSEMSYSISGTVLGLNIGICGARLSASSENTMTYLDGSGSFIVDFGNYSQTRLSQKVTTPFDFSVFNSANGRSVNDNASTKRYTGSPFVSSISLYIFRVNGFTTPNSIIRLTSFKINDGAIMDLIPVLKDGVPCLYDSVSGSFLHNAVSGHQFGYKRKDGTIVDPY